MSALRHHRCPVGLGEKAALLSPAPAASSLRLPRSHLSFCLFFPTEQGEPEAWKGFWAISRTQRGCFELLPNTGRLRLAKVCLRAVLLMGLTNSDNNLLPPPSGPRKAFLLMVWRHGNRAWPLQDLAVVGARVPAPTGFSRNRWKSSVEAWSGAPVDVAM